MPLHPRHLAEFRERLSRARGSDDGGWEASRRLVASSEIHTTLGRLLTALQHAVLPSEIKKEIELALCLKTVNRVQDLPGERLKELTGLGPTKAIRVLSLFLGLTESPTTSIAIPNVVASQVEDFVRSHKNPFDLLLEADVASLLDLGAGDLSFASELVSLYLPSLSERHQPFTVHCLDRLHPRSKLGGPLHAEQDLLQRLQWLENLRFRFWGDQDMFTMNTSDRGTTLAPRYTIVTCWAPATPTFAYEPTRLSRETIHEHLRLTKGTFQTVRVDGEDALEVNHTGRMLLFPPWKFDIRGPLALLDLMARRGLLCILGAVDTQVFWELLSQLVADPRLRAMNDVLTPDRIADRWDTLFRPLNDVPVGSALNLSDVTSLRPDIPHVLPQREGRPSTYRFRHVEIRRGAVFEGMPVSSTAKRFKDMAEETPPWFLILVPDDPSRWTDEEAIL
ncbi:MAG: hypothetical protein ACT4OO_13395 [Nitrospiraceae bacterium]